MKQAAAPFFRRTMARRDPAGSAASSRPTRSPRRPGCRWPTSRTSSTAPACATGTRESRGGCTGCSRGSTPRTRCASSARDRPHAVARAAARARSTTATCNMPGGEFFFSPLEDSAEGTIFFDVPTALRRAPVSGDPADASARAGSRRRRRSRARPSCSPRSTSTRARASSASSGSAATPASRGRCGTSSTTRRWPGRSTSRSAPATRRSAATNVSSLHWDLVKDLRAGGRIELDGEVVQENGTWLI